MRKRAKRNSTNRLYQHLFAFSTALKAMRTYRWAVVVNSAILGISICLPLSLYLGSKFISEENDNSNPGQLIYLEFATQVPHNTQQEIKQSIAAHPLVDQVELLTRQAILDDVTRRIAYEELDDFAFENPFSDTLVVKLTRQRIDRLTIDSLLRNWQAKDEFAKVSRYFTLSTHPDTTPQLYGRITMILIPILILSVALMCGNMVRNQLLRQSLEIEITRYCGGDPKFLRRPFLYWGVAQALCGALTAIVIVGLGWMLLKSPLNAHFSFATTPLPQWPLSIGAAILTITSAGLLGLTSAWLTAKFHLRAELDS